MRQPASVSTVANLPTDRGRRRPLCFAGRSVRGVYESGPEHRGPDAGGELPLRAVAEAPPAPAAPRTSAGYGVGEAGGRSDRRLARPGIPLVPASRHDRRAARRGRQCRIAAMSPLERVTRVLEETPGVRLAVLFGSRRASPTAGTATLTWASRGWTAPSRGGTLAVTLERAAGRRVDVVWLDEAPPLLRFEIARDGVSWSSACPVPGWTSAPGP